MKEIHAGEGAAHVVAVSMGYGHERAASSLLPFAVDKRVTIANDYPGIPDTDKNLWALSRRWYERISRFKKVPILGTAAFGILDWTQKIEPFYPRRDLSEPTLQLRNVYALMRHRNWNQHLVEMLGKHPKPFLSTFSIPAFAAEEFNYPEDIYVVCCDADVARAWAPLNPYKSRIKYLAPTGRVAERLQLYGVRSENIILTGFPLPMEAVGGPEAKQAVSDLSRRMCRLDPKAVFLTQAAAMLEAQMGPMFCENVKKKTSEAVSVTFAIGGAGAQREIGTIAAKSLAQSILAGKLQLNLVAGIRPEVGEYFRAELKKAGLEEAMHDGRVKIIENKDRHQYFSTFNKLMMETDILWTKPSELSFYVGLGIPLLMSPTVGSQEDFNRNWLFQVGAGVDALDPRYADEWLWDWIAGGAFARMAWNGYINAPTHGAYRIEDVVRGRPFTMHPLPLVV